MMLPCKCGQGGFDPTFSVLTLPIVGTVVNI